MLIFSPCGYFKPSVQAKGRAPKVRRWSPLLFKAARCSQHPGSLQAGFLCFQGWHPQTQSSRVLPSRLWKQGGTDTGFLALGGLVPELKAQPRNTVGKVVGHSSGCHPHLTGSACYLCLWCASTCRGIYHSACAFQSLASCTPASPHAQ